MSTQPLMVLIGLAPPKIFTKGWGRGGTRKKIRDFVKVKKRKKKCEKVFSKFRFSETPTLNNLDVFYEQPLDGINFFLINKKDKLINWV